MRSFFPSSRATAMVALVLVIAPYPLTPAVIVIGGACSLADAITAANTDSAAGGCSAGAGSDELQLTADVTLAAALPGITSDITLQGNSATIARTGGVPGFGIFSVVSSSFALLNATVTNGRATNGGAIYAANGSTVEVSNATLTRNHATQDGGALHVGYQTTVAITNSTLSSNTAGNRGGAISSYRYAQTEVVISGSSLRNNAANKGGGLAIDSEGVATITNSTLSGNSAMLSGGGIYSGFGALTTVTDSTVSGNSSAAFGGGVTNYGALAAVSNTTLSENSAAQGGGIYNAFGLTTVTNSTVSGNSATTAGGGIYNGISGLADLTHSTVSGNSAATAGGGIYNSFGEDVNLVNTIVANQVSGDNCSGAGFIDGGGNFDDDGTCPGGAPITAGVDFDTTLAHYGGPTRTHALLAGSVAIDQSGACGLATDQRGFPRDDSACDSGSVEFGAGTVGGSITGLRAREVGCINASTSQSFRFLLSGSTTWDCEAQGLSVSPGDIVRQLVTGRSSDGASGSVVGMVSTGGSCTNLTTGQSVALPATDPSWDCAAEGLIVSLGDRIDLRVSGTVP